MQAVIFIGIPASGKSTYFKQAFADTHVRINRDMLGTAHRQDRLLQVCCETAIPFVYDNTNVQRGERQPAIAQARKAGFKVSGYFFESKIQACRIRNSQRSGKARIPDAGLSGRRNALQLPELSEGFDELWFVRIDDRSGQFLTTPWLEQQP